MEMIATGTARHDICPLRFGAFPRQPTPGRSDDRLGRVSNKMAPVIKRVYDQMSEPKWVIAMGICASAGGPFNNYAIIQGWTRFCRSMSMCPAARLAPRRCSMQSTSCARSRAKRALPNLRTKELSDVFAPVGATP
jgi:Ni,Fe-hydrogenase III small subunit